MFDTIYMRNNDPNFNSAYPSIANALTKAVAFYNRAGSLTENGFLFLGKINNENNNRNKNDAYNNNNSNNNNRKK